MKWQKHYELVGKLCAVRRITVADIFPPSLRRTSLVNHGDSLHELVPWHLMSKEAPHATSSYFLPLLRGFPTLPSVGHAEELL